MISLYDQNLVHDVFESRHLDWDISDMPWDEAKSDEENVSACIKRFQEHNDVILIELARADFHAMAHFYYVQLTKQEDRDYFRTLMPEAVIRTGLMHQWDGNRMTYKSIPSRTENHIASRYTS